MKRIWIAAAAFLTAATAYADTLSYDPQTARVAFSVDASGSATAYAPAGADGIFYAKELSDTDGKIADDFRLSLGVKSGGYTLSVVTEQGERIFNFRHINAAQAKTALEKIAAAKNADAVYAALDEYKTDLGIDADAFAAYGKAVCEYLAAGGVDSDAANFWYGYHSALILAKAKGLSAATELDAVLAEEAVNAGFDYDAYAKCTENVKNEVRGRLARGVMSEKAADALDIWTALAELNNTESVGRYTTLLTQEYAELFGIDTAQFNSSKYKTEIIKEVMKPTDGYNTAAALSAAYDAAVKKYAGSSSDSTGGGGGGSGSSSGSGGSSVAIPGTAANTQPVGFADIDGHWAVEIIGRLGEDGILSGDGGNFYPDNSITRAEFCTMTARSLYAGTAAVSGAKFSDVSAGDWFYPYVSLLAEKGIVNGMGDGGFAPARLITREEMAVIAARCLPDGTGAEGEPDFRDSDSISEFSRGAVAYLARENIFSGTPEGDFNPKNNLTRAEAAVVIYKLMQRLGAYR